MTLEHLLTGLLEFATNEQGSKSVGKALKEGGKETLDRVTQRMCAPVKGRPLLLAGIRPLQRLSCFWYDDGARCISYDTAEAHIGTAHHVVTGTYRDAHAHVQGVVSLWIGVENRVEGALRFILPLPPSPLYSPVLSHAAIALLATSILTRHRGLLLRAAFPPLAGAAAFAHFLSHLSASIRAYAGTLEDVHLPHVHETGKEHSAGAWARLAEQGAETREKAPAGWWGLWRGCSGRRGCTLGRHWGVKGSGGEGGEGCMRWWRISRLPRKIMDAISHLHLSTDTAYHSTSPPPPTCFWRTSGPRTTGVGCGSTQ
ncbi:hypothetical protein B0H14DRAFT_3871691 [Mycena olivaceomarginata]|nr:hypothetical protein B0H14DRAFT_3871691 [Mycena olivaceomarginata]